MKIQKLLIILLLLTSCISPGEASVEPLEVFSLTTQVSLNDCKKHLIASQRYSDDALWGWTLSTKGCNVISFRQTFCMADDAIGVIQWDSPVSFVLGESYSIKFVKYTSQRVELLVNETAFQAEISSLGYSAPFEHQHYRVIPGDIIVSNVIVNFSHGYSTSCNFDDIYLLFAPSHTG